MKRIYLFRKYGILYLWVLLLVVSVSVWAAEPRRRSRETGRSETETRKEQMEPEVQAMASVVQKALTDLWEPVQKNQHPSEGLIQNAQYVLENTKRYFPGFDDKPKAQFMLLQAWTAFYQDKPDVAFNWSIRACKTDEASQDAWISQAVFGLLNGRPPAIPRIEKPQSQSQPERTINRRPRYNQNETTTETKPEPYSEKGTLEFDLLGVNIRAFHERFERMEFQTTSGQKIEYTPGTDTACILFWEDIPAGLAAMDAQRQPSNETQNEVQRAMQEAAPEIADGMDMGLGDLYNSQKTGLESQRYYFEVLMDACKDKPEIKFLQINTFKPSPQGVLDVLPDDKPGPIPTVIAAAPQSNAQKFVGWPAKKPFMVIIDKEGKVKYAGTAADFVPALILTELTGVEVDLAKQAQTTDTGLMPTPGMSVTPETPVTPEIMDPMMMEMMMSGMMPPTPAPRQVPEPNKPAADPNTPADPNAPAKVEQHAQPRPPMQSSGPLTLSLEDQVRAQHLLELAQMKIGESLRLRSNPKQGVEACREILAQFPNTQYAQQARELLRQVPERYKKMNNITDEELGY